MLEEKKYLTNWDLSCVDKDRKINYLKVSVPGDITNDLYSNNIIKNPFFALNHKDISWILEKDFIYETSFNVDEIFFNEDKIILFFDSIDLFADIYLNDKFIGKTENMFLQYKFEVKDLLKKKNNKLRVYLHSTKKEMNKIDANGYFGIFNTQRIFIRKAQCHFGWDWAPNMPGYGICGDVYLIAENNFKIDDVYYFTNDDYVSFVTELNYNVRKKIDYEGHEILNDKVGFLNDQLNIYVEIKPNSEQYLRKEIAVNKKINVTNIKIENAQLWWPSGYGKQNLYKYRIELLRDNKIVSIKKGKFAFRKVELIQQPKDENLIGFDFYINNKKIFMKGSNWVPIECFTGCIQDKKYNDLITLAKKCNMNMLRVWGGGIYEKDKFYDLCDEQGIMIFQDFMFACSDLPENNEKWFKNTLNEVEYQIKRLRNHPCIVYWSGGNEKTGTTVYQPTRGDYFIDKLLTGTVKTLDFTRPFGKQSPCGLTEVANDLESGDCHYNSCEATVADIDNTGKSEILRLREFISNRIVAFQSECASIGPNSIETNKKIYPKDKLWPINEIWEDRMMDNPYSGQECTFAKRLLILIRDMYGEAKNVYDFTAKGMQHHAEVLRAEIEYMRSNREKTGGILNWMYSDIWPSGTWSIVDYFCEPKQAYYQMKRSFEPILVSFVQNKDKTTNMFIVNDTLGSKNIEIIYGQKNLNGDVLFKKNVNVNISGCTSKRIKIEEKILSKNCYLFAYYKINKEEKITLYSKDFWSSCDFESDYDFTTKLINKKKLEINVMANKFVKSLYFTFDNNFDYIFSDNYIDIEKGKNAKIIVESKNNIDISKLKMFDFASVKQI